MTGGRLAAALSASRHLAWPLMACLATFPAPGPHRPHKFVLLFLAAAWAFSNWNHPRFPFRSGPRALPVLLALALLFAFAAAGYLSVINFSNSDWGDISYYLSSFHTSEGLLPGMNVVSTRPFLSHHSEFLCIPVGWIFRLHPGPGILLATQALVAALAFWLFRSWMLKRCSDKVAAEWIAFAFALSPCLLAPLLKGFHGIALAAPLLVLTATAYHDGKWGRFLAALLLLLMVKESFTLTALSLGAFALVQRRSAKWIAVPIALGLGYGLFLKLWYFPAMLGNEQYFYASFFHGWEKSLRRLLSGETLAYAGLVLLWGGTAAVLRTPYTLLALPSLGMNMVLNEAFIHPQLHYVVEPTFWMFFAGASTFLRNAREGGGAADPGVADILDRRDGRRMLVGFLLCLGLMNGVSREGAPLYRHHPFGESYRKALNLLPEGATLSLGAPLEDHLWKLRRYYWIKFAKQPWLEYDSQGACRSGEYALLQKKRKETGGNDQFDPDEWERIQACRESLSVDPGYETLHEDSVLILLRKRAGG